MGKVLGFGLMFHVRCTDLLRYNHGQPFISWVADPCAIPSAEELVWGLKGGTQAAISLCWVNSVLVPLPQVLDPQQGYNRYHGNPSPGRVSVKLMLAAQVWLWVERLREVKL